MAFSRAVLDFDPVQETDRITSFIRNTARELRRRGAVLGLSGGVDSSVTAALCARALGPERVLGVMMPESDSDPDSMDLGGNLGQHLGIHTIVEDITPILEAAGCYRRRDDAVREVIPDYDSSWRCKIVLPNVTEAEGFRLFSVVARAPDGREVRERMTPTAYFGVIAATNFKQRTRAMVAYHHADRLNYAMVGTPNRLEYDQGFFVKNGDGAADIKPIAHLYKTQVYALGRWLGLPGTILARPPTTDTYSLPQSQDEFFFSLPYDLMDLCLWARNNGVSAAEAAPVVGLDAEGMERVFRDIDSKRRAAAYLHRPPAVLGAPPEPLPAGALR